MRVVCCRPAGVFKEGRFEMTRLCAAIVTFGLVLAASPCRAGVDVEAEKAAVARVVDASIGWFATKDFDLLFRTMADDEDFFSFTPDSKGGVHGRKALEAKTAIWRDPEAKYVSHEIRELRIHLHPSGEVAWFSAILDDCGEYGGQVGCWKDTRWTGVLEQREGRWVLMQQHFSFAADQVRERVEKRVREELASETEKP